MKIRSSYLIIARLRRTKVIAQNLCRVTTIAPYSETAAGVTTCLKHCTIYISLGFCYRYNLSLRLRSENYHIDVHPKELQARVSGYAERKRTRLVYVVYEVIC